MMRRLAWLLCLLFLAQAVLADVPPRPVPVAPRVSPSPTAQSGGGVSLPVMIGAALVGAGIMMSLRKVIA